MRNENGTFKNGTRVRILNNSIMKPYRDMVGTIMFCSTRSDMLYAVKFTPEYDVDPELFREDDFVPEDVLSDKIVKGLLAAMALDKMDGDWWGSPDLRESELGRELGNLFTEWKSLTYRIANDIRDKNFKAYTDLMDFDNL